MRLSTRNQLAGTITEVSVGAVMASVKVRLDGGDQVVTASITKEAVEELGLEAGKRRDGPHQVDRGHARRRVTRRWTVRAEAEVKAGGEHLGPVGGRTVGSLA